MRIEALIVGQGLAGTALAWELRRRGISFLIVDPAAPTGCSRAAAGILTPLAGQRLAPSWRLEEALPLARQTYDEVAQVTGSNISQPYPFCDGCLTRLSKNGGWSGVKIRR
ncbi:MAG: FAD-dependent oxidoreductase [Verrucomicrobiales bacterium]